MAIATTNTNVVQFQPKVPAVIHEPEIEVSGSDVHRLLLAVMLRTMGRKHRQRADVFLSVAERTEDLGHRAVVKKARSILGVSA
jgi:hypothetical protein